ADGRPSRPGSSAPGGSRGPRDDRRNEVLPATEGSGDGSITSESPRPEGPHWRATGKDPPLATRECSRARSGRGGWEVRSSRGGPLMSVSNEDTPDPLELKLVRALGRPGQWCWKVYSDRLDRVLWIARDAASAALLIQSADEPVLFQDDLDDLESLAP